MTWKFTSQMKLQLPMLLVFCRERAHINLYKTVIALSPQLYEPISSTTSKAPKHQKCIVSLVSLNKVLPSMKSKNFRIVCSKCVMAVKHITYSSSSSIMSHTLTSPPVTKFGIHPNIS